jgi:hypothetical protein
VSFRGKLGVVWGRVLSAEERLHYLMTLALDLRTSLLDVRATVNTLANRLGSAEPERSFVYVLPPTGPMMVQSARVPAGGQSLWLTFEPYTVVPPETWVIVAGPAVVKGVRVGNQCQSFMNDFQGHVCKLADSVIPGTRLMVELG